MGRCRMLYCMSMKRRSRALSTPPDSHLFEEAPTIPRLSVDRVVSPRRYALEGGDPSFLDGDALFSQPPALAEPVGTLPLGANREGIVSQDESVQPTAPEAKRSGVRRLLDRIGFVRGVPRG